eukprot:SAG22_NODE_85_length_21510_cov_6.472187_11_plen_426_part_00
MLSAYAGDAAKAAAAAAVADEWGADVGADALAAALDPLPFAARVSAVSKWASRNSKADGGAHCHQVQAAIAGLTKQTAPAAIEVPAAGGGGDDDDDDFNEIFNDQQTSLHETFDRQQLGMFAAAAAKDKAAIAASATGPSRMMKKLSLKEVARDLSAAEAPDTVLKALPADRKILVQNMIRFRKTAALDAVFEQLRALDGDGAAARIVHGCGGGTVGRSLPSLMAKANPSRSRLLWPKLWRFHEAELLALLETALRDNPHGGPLGYHAVWTEWTGRFTAPAVRTLPPALWGKLFALYQAHRPFVLRPHRPGGSPRDDAAAAAAEEAAHLQEMTRYVVQDCNSGPLPLRMPSKSFPVCVLDHVGARRPASWPTPTRRWSGCATTLSAGSSPTASPRWAPTRWSQSSRARWPKRSRPRPSSWPPSSR